MLLAALAAGAVTRATGLPGDAPTSWPARSAGAPLREPPAVTTDALVPRWAAAAPRRVMRLEAGAPGDELGAGRRLRQAVAALRPGDRLELGDGEYALDAPLTFAVVATVEDPVALVAAPGAHAVLRGVDEDRNVLHVGRDAAGTARFALVRGLEITGGSAGVRVLGADDVWIDRCEIHHTGEVALTANTHDVDGLFLTRNDVHHTGGYGEGFYLGGNHGEVVLSRSTIAANHVHDTGGRQGDGIELKQGSWGCRIVGNLVHDTLGPCLVVYGAGGRAPNLIERNVLVRAGDAGLQVQGEAVVRRNVVVGGRVGVATGDHQDRSRDLLLADNVVVAAGPALRLREWHAPDPPQLRGNVLVGQASSARLAALAAALLPP